MPRTPKENIAIAGWDPSGPRAAWAQVGPGTKWVLAQVFPGSKWAKCLSVPWALMGLARDPWVQLGSVPSEAQVGPGLSVPGLSGPGVHAGTRARARAWSQIFQALIVP